jgi:hexosaminidase
VEGILNSRGKKLVGWDEILEGGLAPRATVMSWRGFEGGIAAATTGHDVIMTPTSHCYFDYYQAPPENQPLAIGGFLPVSTVYQFNPVPDSLDSEQRKHVLGGQANLWSEYIPTPEHCFYMMFPRLEAMAEVLWSGPDPEKYEDFLKRMNTQIKRYENSGINYCKTVL